MIQKKRKTVIKYLLLLLGVLFIVLPIYITVITPFKTPAENAVSFYSFPKNFYVGNIMGVLTSGKYYRALLNTLFVTSFTLLGCVAIMPLMSYAISRSMQKSKAYTFLYYFLLIGIFIPFQVKMMPLVILMSRIHMMNQIGLICLAIGSATCESVFLYVGFLNAIPRDIENAAEIDGASSFTIYRLVVMPLMVPIISTVMIKDGLWMWNDFMMPLIILNRTWKAWTLTLFQYNFKTQFTTDYSMSFATFLMSMIPILVFYIVMQRKIISGLTSGALKD